MLLKFLTSSLGKKYLMGLTGLAWSLFVMTHMLGNMLIFVGAEAYNRYAHALVTNPFIYVAEAGLVVFLLIHAVTGIRLALKNWDSKPTKYAVRPMGTKGASLSSRTMIYTGSMMLVFVIYHLITFKYGADYRVSYAGVEMRDIHRLVVEVFRSPAYVVWYLVCLVLVGFHLYHGVKSSFQTLGLNHPRYNNAIKNFGYVYSVVVAAGFISQPLFILLSR